MVLGQLKIPCDFDCLKGYTRHPQSNFVRSNTLTYHSKDTQVFQ